MRKQRTSDSQKGEPTSALRVASYIRVSTAEQRQSGLGLDAQRETVRRKKDEKGWSEPVEYADEGVSGARAIDKRPALSRLMHAVRRGEVDAIIVPSVDRIGRDALLILAMVRELDAHRVLFASCREPHLDGTPTGNLVLGIMATIAQFERDVSIQRTKGAMQAKSRKDGYTGGRVKYGYRRTDAGLVIDTEQAETVKYIFSVHRRGESLRDIAQRLNEKGIAGPRGGKWNHMGVRVIIRGRDAYRGGKRGLSDIRWPSIL